VGFDDGEIVGLEDVGSTDGKFDIGADVAGSDVAGSEVAGAEVDVDAVG
jgi:hypothetical protein